MLLSRRLRVGGVALSVALMSSGCASSGHPATSPRVSPSTSGASDSSLGTPAAGNTSNGPITPAGWQIVPIKGVAEVAAPPSWTSHPPRLLIAKDRIGVQPGYAVLTTNPGIGGDVQSEVDRIGADQERGLHLAGKSNIKRLPNVTYGGWPFYHIQYGTSVDLDDQFGTVTRDGQEQIMIVWTFLPAAVDRAGSAKIINQVMPTFRLL